MHLKHGNLENVILTALWKLEQKGTYSNSVLDIYNMLLKNESKKRAYTTIKTVMDRLTEKKLLHRFKQGRKFCYRSVYSNKEMLTKELIELARKYCEGNLNTLLTNINGLYESAKEANYISA